MKLFAALSFLMVFAPAQCQIKLVEEKFRQYKGEYLNFEKEHGHFIQTDKTKLHYLTWGKPGDKPIIWIHGSHSNAYEFYSFAETFARDGYYVIAIDYFGHGLTAFPTAPYTIYDVADDIKYLLDSKKIEKIVIGGWSRGGSIATAFYDSYPSRVAGIILEDGGSVPWAKLDHRQSIDSLSTKLRKQFEIYAKEGNIQFDSQFDAVRQMTDFSDRGRAFFSFAAIKQLPNGKWAENPGLAKNLGEESIDDFLQLLYRPFGSDKIFGASTVLLNPTTIYRNLKVPLLILDPISDRDQFRFEDENAQLQKSHPQLITHKIYPQTSHGLKFQKGDQFLKDLQSFVHSIRY